MSAYWKHLRVPFQLTLTPLFLWGLFLALPASPSPVLIPDLYTLIPAFIAFHFFLYTGITAFNSAYDRDEGPVGGMLHPPAVPPHLLEVSLAVQAVGAVLAAIAGHDLLVIYLMIAGMGFAYSHPRLRWKARPLASALTVCIGQGALGSLAGWVVVRGNIASVWEEKGVLGMAAAAFTTLGLYPLTQVYQIAEDRARGDRTLAVILGPVGALRFGMACLGAAGVAAVTVMARHYGALDAACMTAAYGILLTLISRFARDFRRDRHTVVSAFYTAMRLNVLASTGFLAFILLHLLRR